MVIVLVSCAKHETKPVPMFPPGCEDTISFSTQIQPMFHNNCSVAGCHDQGTAQNGFILETYPQIKMHADTSLRTIRHQPGVEPMPFGAPQLEDSLIHQLRCWIEQGRMNN